ncbi:hypothetical protein D3C73_1402780 [compost metagenome]
MIVFFALGADNRLGHQHKRIVIQRILQRRANIGFIHNMVAEHAAMLRFQVFGSAVGQRQPRDHAQFPHQLIDVIAHIVNQAIAQTTAKPQPLIIMKKAKTVSGLV